jgi:hypothetical protein
LPNHTSAVAVTLFQAMTISNLLHHGRGGIAGYRKDHIVARIGSNRHREMAGRLSQFVGTDDHQRCECRHGFIQSNERDVMDDNGRIRQPILRAQARPGHFVDRQSQRSERLTSSKCSRNKALTRHSVVINNGNIVVLAVDGIRSGIDYRHISRIDNIHGSG